MRDGYPKYTATYVFEWPGRSPDLHPVETLWQDLEIVVHGRSSSISLTELELFSKEEWPQRADSAGAELVETNADRLAALIAVKCGSTASNTRHFSDFFFLFRIVCCVSFSLHLAVMHCFVTAPLKYISVCGNNVTRRGIVQAV